MISWLYIVMTVHIWIEVSLSSIKNSKPVSVFELNFLKLLQKSIFCQIYNHGIPEIILHKFWQIFFAYCIFPYKSVSLICLFSFINNLDQASALKVIACTFKPFGGLELFNGCLAVWPNNLHVRNVITFKIQNWCLWSMILKFS